MGEKFDVAPATGTASASIPLPVSPSRQGLRPDLSLRYDSGSGNGPFGFGWQLSLISITRKTDKGLPRYADVDESDVFILSGAEDLVPLLDEHGERVRYQRRLHGVHYQVCPYRPRVEGSFARIERWVALDSGISHWRTISRDNVTALYGFDPDSRIAAPDDPRKIFAYLPCRRFDDRGNLTLYQYAAEDGAGVAPSAHEANRREADRAVQRYLKRVLYGNRRPYEPDWSEHGPETPLPDEWLFEVVLDYGDHRSEAPTPMPDRPWPVRPDPFSSYRAGFEVRTYRRCRRSLLFHHFRDEPDVGAACLVRSVDFTYGDEDAVGDPRFPLYSFLRSATQIGYRREGNGYRSGSLPPVEFEYSRPQLTADVQTLDAESFENLPEGLDSARYRWLDLDGEGAPGVLVELGGAWGYKRNLSPAEAAPDRSPRARLGPLETVSLQPARRDGDQDGQRFADLSGDGQIDLVSFAGSAAGFYERTRGGRWESFRPFRSLPIVDWDDPNLRLVDLSGDGLADLLLFEDDAFRVYRSLGEDGFEAAELVRQSLDEERGPRVVLADSRQAVFLADMSGDGLGDIVRVRNGEVCYWPSLGYGRFGPKVTMDRAPRFTEDDRFDPRRVRLADVDGTGTSDLLYVGEEGVVVCFNLSGNAWAEPHRLAVFPTADSLSSVEVLDLLGTGTACLVWSSPMPQEGRRPLRYVDLMGGAKPHLLVGYRNNLGTETRVHYAPSTRFYVQDRLAGRPWLTRLPFPVQVVERVETYDRVSRNRFVTRYAYHHGYFDGYEREFRGFGLVEQWDTEEFTALAESGAFPTGDNFDATSHVPPIYVRTWFHTGAYLESGPLARQHAAEYWREPGLTNAEAEALLLPDTVLPRGLTPGEEREAYRALKGLMLRQETYGLDDTVRQCHPYLVAEQNFAIRVLQRRGPNRYAVLFTHPREAIRYHYERNPADPRVSHRLTLEVDDFGNVLKEVTVGYGRRRPDPTLLPDDRARQTRALVTYTENRVTNAVDEAWAYRTPLPSESRTYELTGFVPENGARFEFAAWMRDGLPLVASAMEIPFEQEADHVSRQRRLIEHARTRYRKNDLTDLLPLGRLESLALDGESYHLALTPGLLTRVFQRDGQPLLPDPASVLGGAGADQGGYVDLDGDGRWWISSGRVFLSPDPSDGPAAELAHGRNHFFLPLRFQDPYGQTTTVAYDRYDLLLQETRDPLGDRVTAGERDAEGNLVRSGNDYRVLQPGLVMDANRNRAAVAFDARGMVVGTAVMGKPEEQLGDSLDGFERDLPDTEILGYLANPLGDPHALLGQATTRLVYDLFAYMRSKDGAYPQPAAVATLARETHVSDLAPGQQSRIRHSFTYSDAFGREIQKKLQAEPGPAPERDASGRIVVGADGQPVTASTEASPRWVGSGWTVFNNKGKPIRQYEPFFSDTHRFEFDVRVGVSPVLFYDPVGRKVAALHPNHTWEKVVFDPWRQETWDVCDTVLVTDPKSDPDVGDFFRRLPDAEYLPTWRMQRLDGALGPYEQAAAEQTAVHASTPTVAHFDALGRAFLTVVHNRFERDGAFVDERYPTRLELDVQGNQRAARDAIVQDGDARGRLVMRADYDLLGSRIHQASLEAGERWVLNDVTGQPIRAWDSRNHSFRTAYDARRRPTEMFLQEDGGTERLVQRTVYGEAQGDALNHRGRAYQHFDAAGIVTNVAYDFKGNLLESRRQLAQDYRTLPDWSASPALEAETFAARTTFDALNRPVLLITPRTPELPPSVVRPGYNEANLLQRVDVNLHGATSEGEPVWTPIVTNLDYDAKGQRQRIDYGNGVSTRYTYDPLTLRLVRLRTVRGTDRLQDLSYTYDACGNVTHTQDDALQTVYFRNQRVEPSADYTYDAVYRLIEATGREHLGQIGGGPTAYSHDDAPRVGLPQPGDGNAMARYVERYLYDAVGNILAMQHHGGDATRPGWTRTYAYDEASLLEPAKTSNRLSRTAVGDGNPVNEVYAHDAHGNVTAMAHLPLMRWDYRDQLQATARQVRGDGGTPEITYYVYDAAGLRVRKVTERQAAAGETPRRRKERIYFSGFEIYREYGGGEGSVTLERESLHVMDGAQRIALIETRGRGNDAAPPQLIRYQLADHLGSAVLELDQQARIVSYEEFAPYGSTSYQAVRSQTETPKRYRFIARERDEESGLSYHGARYYAPWLGRWVSCDPKGMVDGPSLYAYGRDNPVNNADPTGTQCDPANACCSVDPSLPTPREEALQQSLPEDERYLPPPSLSTSAQSTASSTASTTTSTATSTPSADVAQWELGPRGEHLPTKDWTGGPLRPLSEYDKPWAVELARQGHYEAAELAQNYLCASCHILTKVDPADFNLRGYVRGWQRGYIQGFIEVPLKANPIGAAWEVGVSGGQAITGEGSGLHISNISGVLVDGQSDLGHRLTTSQRLWEGGSAIVGGALMVFGLRAPTPRGLPEGNPFVNLSEAEIDAALSNMEAGQPYRIPTAATEAGHGLDTLVPVSRWGRPGLRPGDWVMNGPPNRTNYVLSFKWDPNPTNIRAPFAAGEGYLVPPSSVRWPGGWGLDGWWKGLFGQRRYIPTPGPGQ